MTDTNITFTKFKWREWLWSPWTLSVILLAGVGFADPNHFSSVFEKAAFALLKTLPFIVFAVAIVAYLRAAGAETIIARVFQGREIQAIVLATLFGGLAPFCSCEVIPFIAAMLALGAPLSAVMAFWLSSPLIDPPTLLITASVLGWEYAIGKTAAALGLGFLGGFVVLGITKTGAWGDILKPQLSAGCGCGPAVSTQPPVWKFWLHTDRRKTFATEAQTNGMFLLKWLALAYVIESLMIMYIPDDWIANTLGGQGIMPIIFGAVLGMPAYLNSYVAAPLLSGLLDQGMQPGAVLSFMTAGAVSSIPAMAAVYSLVRIKVFALYVVLGLVGAILAGLMFSLII